MPDGPIALIDTYHRAFRDELGGMSPEEFRRHVYRSEDEDMIEGMAEHLYEQKYRAHMSREDFDEQTGLNHWRDENDVGFVRNVWRGMKDVGAELIAGELEGVEHMTTLTGRQLGDGGVVPGPFGMPVGLRPDQQERAEQQLPENQQAELDTPNAESEIDRLKRELRDYDPGYKPTYSWEEVEETMNPLKAFVWGVETGLISTPHMAMAFTLPMLPAYIVGLSGQMAHERAQNDGRDEATEDDFAAVLPFAVFTGLAERFGARAIGGIGKGPARTGKEFFKRVGKGTGAETATETVQNIGETIATHVGTKAWADKSAGEIFAHIGESGLQGAIAGGSFGVAASTPPAAISYARNRGTPEIDLDSPEGGAQATPAPEPPGDDTPEGSINVEPRDRHHDSLRMEEEANIGVREAIAREQLQSGQRVFVDRPQIPRFEPVEGTVVDLGEGVFQIVGDDGEILEKVDLNRDPLPEDAFIYSAKTIQPLTRDERDYGQRLFHHANELAQEVNEHDLAQLEKLRNDKMFNAVIPEDQRPLIDIAIRKAKDEIKAKQEQEKLDLEERRRAARGEVAERHPEWAAEEEFASQETVVDVPVRGGQSRLLRPKEVRQSIDEAVERGLTPPTAESVSEFYRQAASDISRGLQRPEMERMPRLAERATRARDQVQSVADALKRREDDKAAADLVAAEAAAAALEPTPEAAPEPSAKPSGKKGKAKPKPSVPERPYNKARISGHARGGGTIMSVLEKSWTKANEALAAMDSEGPGLKARLATRAASDHLIRLQKPGQTLTEIKAGSLLSNAAYALEGVHHKDATPEQIRHTIQSGIDALVEAVKEEEGIVGEQSQVVIPEFKVPQAPAAKEPAPEPEPTPAEEPEPDEDDGIARRRNRLNEFIQVLDDIGNAHRAGDADTFADLVQRVARQTNTSGSVASRDSLLPFKAYTEASAADFPDAKSREELYIASLDALTDLRQNVEALEPEPAAVEEPADEPEAEPESPAAPRRTLAESIEDVRKRLTNVLASAQEGEALSDEAYADLTQAYDIALESGVGALPDGQHSVMNLLGRVLDESLVIAESEIREAIEQTLDLLAAETSEASAEQGESAPKPSALHSIDTDELVGDIEEDPAGDEFQGSHKIEGDFETKYQRSYEDLEAEYASGKMRRMHDDELVALALGAREEYRKLRDEGQQSTSRAAYLASVLRATKSEIDGRKEQGEQVQVSEDSEILREHDITVRREVERANKREYFRVYGETKPIAAYMKHLGDELGGLYRGDIQAWSYTQDPTSKLAEFFRRGRGGAEIKDEFEDVENIPLTPEISEAEVKEHVREDTRELLRRGSEFGIPDEILGWQEEDAALVLRKFKTDPNVEPERMFLVASQPGSGKTFVLGAVMREILRYKPNADIMYVTLNRDTLIPQVKRDLGDFIDPNQIRWVTYADIQGQQGQSVVNSVGPDTVIIFDESHSVKNIGGPTAKRAKRAQVMMSRANFTVMASATPFENPAEAVYLEPTRAFAAEEGFDNWVKQFGVKIDIGDDSVTYTWGGSPLAAANARGTLVRKGIYSFRPLRVPPEMTQTSFVRKTIPEDMARLYYRAQQAYTWAMGQAADPGTLGRIEAQRVNALNRIMETGKVAAAIERARAALAEGKNPVIFTQTKAARHLGRARLRKDFIEYMKKNNNKLSRAQTEHLYSYEEMRPWMDAWENTGERTPPPFAKQTFLIAEGFATHRIDYKLPSVPDTIAEALGDDAVLYHGDVSTKQNETNLTDFMEGRKKALVVTMDKGGTGLSLHDTVGDRPRALIGLNLPWTASKMDQVLGRVTRYGMQSRAEVEWIYGENMPIERHVAGRVHSRMQTMGLQLRGEPPVIAGRLTDEMSKQQVMTPAVQEILDAAPPLHSVPERNPSLKEELEMIARRLAPFAELNLPRFIRTPEGGYAKGMFNEVGLRKIISVAMNGDNPRNSLRHEAIHALRASGFINGRQWSTLLRSAHRKDWLGKHRVAERYPELFVNGVATEAAYEEAVAEEFAEWADGKYAARQTSKVREIFEKLMEFFREMTWALRRHGYFAPATSIFHDIESGRIGSDGWMHQWKVRTAGMPKQQGRPTFYSHLARVAEESKEPHRSAEEWMKYIRKPQRGVSMREIDDMEGFENVLHAIDRETGGRVTREHILEVIEGMAPRLEIVSYGQQYVREQMEELGLPENVMNINSIHDIERDGLARTRMRTGTILSMDERVPIPLEDVANSLEYDLTQIEGVDPQDISRIKSILSEHLAFTAPGNVSPFPFELDDFKVVTEGGRSWFVPEESGFFHEDVIYWGLILSLKVNDDFTAYYTVQVTPRLSPDGVTYRGHIENVDNNAEAENFLSANSRDAVRNLARYKLGLLDENVLDARWSGYVHGGGTNYREFLVTMPGRLAGGRNVHWEGMDDVLLHVRTTDRVIGGKKTLFVEEIQSDFHQQQQKIEEQRRLNPNIPDDEVKIDRPYRGSGNWTTVAWKQVLEVAANEGFEQIAWAEGRLEARMEGVRDADKVAGMTHFYNNVLSNSLNKYVKRMRWGAASQTDVVRAPDGDFHYRQLKGDNATDPMEFFRVTTYADVKDALSTEEGYRLLKAEYGREIISGFREWMDEWAREKRGIQTFDEVVKHTVNRRLRREAERNTRQDWIDRGLLSPSDPIPASGRPLAFGTDTAELHEEYMADEERVRRETRAARKEHAQDALNSYIKSEMVRRLHKSITERTGTAQETTAELIRVGFQGAPVGIHTLEITDKMREEIVARGQPKYQKSSPHISIPPFYSHLRNLIVEYPHDSALPDEWARYLTAPGGLRGAGKGVKPAKTSEMVLTPEVIAMVRAAEAKSSPKRGEPVQQEFREPFTISKHDLLEVVRQNTPHLRVTQLFYGKHKESLVKMMVKRRAISIEPVIRRERKPQTANEIAKSLATLINEEKQRMSLSDRNSFVRRAARQIRDITAALPRQKLTVLRADRYRIRWTKNQNYYRDWDTDPFILRMQVARGGDKERVWDLLISSGIEYGAPRFFNVSNLSWGNRARRDIRRMERNDHLESVLFSNMPHTARAQFQWQPPRYPQAIHKPPRSHDGGVPTPESINYREFQMTSPGLWDAHDGSGGHFDLKDMLVWYRTTDRKVGGVKTLLIEEIQSDFHQKKEKEENPDRPETMRPENLPWKGGGNWGMLAIRHAIEVAVSEGYRRVGWVEGYGEAVMENASPPGIRRFYDEVLVRAADKYIKQFGAKMKMSRDSVYGNEAYFLNRSDEPIDPRTAATLPTKDKIIHQDRILSNMGYGTYKNLYRAFKRELREILPKLIARGRMMKHPLFNDEVIGYYLANQDINIYADFLEWKSDPEGVGQPQGPLFERAISRAEDMHLYRRYIEERALPLALKEYRRQIARNLAATRDEIAEKGEEEVFVGRLEALGDEGMERLYQHLVNRYGKRLPRVMAQRGFITKFAPQTHYFDITPEMKAAVLAYGQPKFQRGETPPITPQAEDPDVEVRMRDAEVAIVSEGFSERVRKGMQNLWHSMSRHRKHMAENRENADVNEKMLHLEHAAHAAYEEIVGLFRRVMDGLSKDEMRLITRKMVLEDLLWTKREQGKDIPFGLRTPEEVVLELRKVDAVLEQRPDLQDRLRLRDSYRLLMREQLLNAGVLDERSLQNPNYFRHQVIQYAELVRLAREGRKVKTPRWLRRRGSELDINMNYFQAEADWLFRAHMDIATKNFLNFLKTSKYNRKDGYARQAKINNQNAMFAKLSDDIRGIVGQDGLEALVAQGARTPIQLAQGFSRLLKEHPEYRAGYARALTLREFDTYRRLIAGSMRGIQDAARQMTRKDLVPEHLRPILDNVIAGYGNRRLDDDGETAPIFKLIKWFAESKDAKEQMPKLHRRSLALLGHISRRRKWMKEVAIKDEWVNPMSSRELIRKFGDFTTEVAWQPDSYDGRTRAVHLYNAYTIPDFVVDTLLEEIASYDDLASIDPEAAKIDPKIVTMVINRARRATVLGPPKEEFILDKNLAETLNTFHDEQVSNAVGLLAREVHALWKRWIIFNPRRFFKYMLNNQASDIDVWIGSGNLRNFGEKLPQAFQELYDFMYRGNEPTGLLRLAIEKAILQSSLTVQELSHYLRDELAPEFGAQLYAGRTKRVARKYFDTTERVARLRENAFRYAAFLHYLEQEQAGVPFDQRDYGATPPEIIHGLSDPLDRAARMARDIMGDYGNLSTGATWARRHMIPFVSWLYSNTVRYSNLFANSYRYARDVSPVKGMTMASWHAFSMLTRLFIPYAAIQLYNILMHPEQEDEYSPEERIRLHVNLGKDDEGRWRSLRFQGALSDFLAWFGLEAAGSTANEWWSGRAGLGDVAGDIAMGPVNRLAQSITPFAQVPIQLMIGGDTYPDVTNPRPIHDPLMHIFRSLSLENEYAQAATHIFGRPVPTRSYADSLYNAFLYRREAGQMAYDLSRGQAFQWKRHVLGGEGARGGETLRARAYRNFRVAQKFGDEEAERLAREQLREFGGRPGRSLRFSRPLGMLSRRERAEYTRTLSPRDLDRLRRAQQWWRETFAP